MLALSIASVAAARVYVGVNTTVDASSLNCVGVPSCQKIYNANSQDYFVPNGTCSDWTAFLNHVPSGLTLSACCTPVTWYLDADNDGYYPAGGTQSSCSSPGAGWTTSVKTAGDCDDSNAAIHAGSTRTMYQSVGVACGTACNSETQTCQSSSLWTGSYASTSCVPSSRTMYQAASVACGSTCTSEGQTCQASGSWTGSYGFASCSIAGASTWYLDADSDGYYPSGGTQSACSSPGAGWTTSVKSAGDCDDSNAGIVPGSVRTMYQSSSVACGGSCTSESQTCQVTGSWTGTYAYSSCSVGACCTPNAYNSCWSGNVWSFDSCNNPQSQVQTCSGSSCSGNTQITNTGCSGSSCTTSSTACPTTNSCSGNTLIIGQGCQGSSCSSSSTDCTSPSALGVPNYPYCSGSTLVTAGVCSGSSCAQTTTNCPNGCAGSPGSASCVSCTPDSYQQCSGGALYWFDSCNQVGNQVDSCQRTFCSGGQLSQYNGCSPGNSYCTGTTSACNSYCSSSVRYFSGNCPDGSNSCSYSSEDCSAVGDICAGDGNIYNGPWTCAPDACQYSSVTTCSGSYCGSDGNVHTRTACSGSSCGDSVTATCSNGCTNGACDPPADACASPPDCNTLCTQQGGSGGTCAFVSSCTSAGYSFEATDLCAAGCGVGSSDICCCS